jgi:hypothetical protein
VSDDQTTPDEQEWEEGPPDGVVIMHFPADGSDPYGVGPFPPIEGLVEQLVNATRCSCRKEALPVIFPKGVTMMVSGVGDMETIMEAAREIVDAVLDQKEGTRRADRLN